MKINQTITKKISAKKTSKGATILYVLLVSLHFSWSFLWFLKVLFYANESGRYWIVFLAPSVVMSYYYLVRELIYKFFHLCGYHAREQLKKFGVGAKSFHLPIFEKSTEDYMATYQQRSKKHQFLYFLSFLFYRNLLLFLLELNCLVFFYLNRSKMIQFGKMEIIACYILLGLQYLILSTVFDKYKNWFLRKNRVKIILIERGFPIFMQDNTL